MKTFVVVFCLVVLAAYATPSWAKEENQENQVEEVEAQNDTDLIKDVPAPGKHSKHGKKDHKKPEPKHVPKGKKSGPKKTDKSKNKSKKGKKPHSSKSSGSSASSGSKSKSKSSSSSSGSSEERRHDGYNYFGDRHALECSVHVKYSVGKDDTRTCSSATADTQSCQGCCISSFRSDKRKSDSSDEVIGFVAVHPKDNFRQCVCCFPKNWNFNPHSQ